MAAPGTDRGQPSDLLRFGTFELDRSRQELRRAGALLNLQSQHHQLLALLVERAGQVVTREEIREMALIRRFIPNKNARGNQNSIIRWLESMAAFLEPV